MNNEINSPYHWRIMRRVETDLGPMYARNHTASTTHIFITAQYRDLLYLLMTEDKVRIHLNDKYATIMKTIKILHTEENQKYLKFYTILMWVTAMFQNQLIYAPLNTRIKIVKRLNKFINDKKTKLYIPVDKRSISSERI